MDYLLSDGGIVAVSGYNPGAVWLQPGLELSDSLWFAGGEMPFFRNHLQQIGQFFESLEQPLPAGFPPPSELQRLLLRLINKNKAFMGGWVVLRFHVGGENSHWIARVLPWPARTPPFHPEGRRAVVSPVPKFSANRLAASPYFAAALWRAERYRAGSPAVLPLLLNEKGALAESAGGNLFCLSGDTLATPSLSTGCCCDTLRAEILAAAETAGFRTAETDSLTPSALLRMDEIFSVSEREGLEWVLGIGRKRFVRVKTEVIWEQMIRQGWQTAGGRRTAGRSG